MAESVGDDVTVPRSRDPGRRRTGAPGGPSDARAVLDAHYRSFMLATPMIEAVHYWQEGGYRTINDIRRGGPGLHERRLALMHDPNLEDAASRATTPVALVAWRGLRHIERMVGSASIADLVGETVWDSGFAATSLRRHVAVRFASSWPPQGQKALLRVVIPAGTPALWVPPVSLPQYGDQEELLLPPGLALLIRSVAEPDDRGIIEIEVHVRHE